MAVNLTPNRYIADCQQFKKQINTSDLFGQEFSIPQRVNELIDELDKKDKISEFCYIIYNLQNTANGYCLDKYQFYLEYEKQNLKQNERLNFSKADAHKMFSMCKKFRFSTLCIIGFMLLYRNYELVSILQFFIANPQNDDTSQECQEALAQEEEINKQAEAQIQLDKKIVYREKDIKDNPPLKDEVVRNRITYSPYSEWGLQFAVKSLQNKEKEFKSSKYQNFIKILYTLQYKKRELKIFDEEKFNEFIKTYWSKYYTEEEFCVRFYGSDVSNIINECNSKLLYLKSNEYYLMNQNGGLWYREQYDLCLRTLDQYKHYTRYDEDCSDIIPNEEECNHLWSTYTHCEDTLVFSIAILLHEKSSEWKRVLYYYLSNRKHVMIAKKPVLDKVDNDPYIIHPQLKRPIDLTIVNRHSNRPKYKNKSTFDIISNWDKSEKVQALRFEFLLITFLLQTNGIKIINADIFKEIFNKQTEIYRVKNDINSLSFDVDMDIDYIMPHYIEDKKELLHEIAMLIDIGYHYQDIYPYYKSLLIDSSEQS